MFSIVGGVVVSLARYPARMLCVGCAIQHPEGVVTEATVRPARVFRNKPFRAGPDCSGGGDRVGFANFDIDHEGTSICLAPAAAGARGAESPGIREASY